MSDSYSIPQARNQAFYRQVARLHMEGINQGFLPQLGLGFMLLLYEALDHCEQSVLIVEQQGGKLIGFVSGAAGMRPVYRQLMRRPFHLMVALAPSLLRPARLKRIYEIVRYSRASNHDTQPDMPAFELLSIAVDPVARGTGCADSLYRQLEDYCRLQGFDGFKIVVGDALAPAHRFYQRMGAVSVGRIEVHEGEGSVVYVQEVGSHSFKEG